MTTLTRVRTVLDIEQVADQLSVKENTIRRLVHEGKLRAYRIGGRRGKLRFKQEDVDRYLESAVVRPDSDTSGTQIRVEYFAYPDPDWLAEDE